MSDDTTPAEDLLDLMAEALTATFKGHPQRRHQALAANRVLAERMWPPVQAALNERDAEIEQLRAGESEQPAPDGQELTPAEWIHKFNRVTVEQRIAHIEVMLSLSRQATVCWQQDHASLKAERDRLKAALGPAVVLDEPCGNREPADGRLTCTLPARHVVHYAAGSGTAWRCLCDQPEAAAAVARVRALHINEHGSCGGCMDVLSVSWPCPTITALGQPEEGTG